MSLRLTDRSRGRRPVAPGSLALALALLGLACTGPSDGPLAPRAGAPRTALAAAMPAVRISEIHYDNAGTDVDEAIEISGPAGTNLAGWSVVLYNGSPTTRTTYTTTALTQTLPATCGARGVVVLKYPVNGIQNGSSSGATEPDGIALVDAAGRVVEFLSYEGSFTAANGPAAGLTSTNIGVYETGTEPVGQSLQRTGNGTWTGPLTATLGSCNDADEQAATPVAAVSVTPATASIAVGATQTLAAAATDAAGQTIGGVTYAWSTSAADVATVDPATGVVTAVAPGEATITAAAPNGVSGTVVVTVTAAAANAANVRITELHYDNDGTDAGEAVELEGDAGSSLAGWKLVLYNGTPGTSTSGQPYATLALSGAFLASCDARGVVVAPAAGLQNGDADGVALVDAAGKVVEFLSYEGSFTATAGPAAGMTSTDVGVAQSTTTPAGRSLQRAGNGSWFGPYTSTFGECNPAVPPAPRAGISFSGRLPSDAPLPVGFQDQLFATVRDANTGASIQTTVTWTSETPAVMSVDARGVVTALTAGTGVVRATAADGTTSTLSLPTEVPPFGDAGAYGDQLAAGAPVRAGDAIRVTRAQYALAYSTARNTPLWVAYRLTRANRGDLPGYRCDCFTTDPVVTAGGGAAITTADYTGSGFDRGHMVRSNDRELARGDQAQTYYMSNIVPQYPNLNQGRWGGLETYLQTVSEGAGHPDVYIVAGVRGDAGTIGNGRIVVPTHTWKVALVLPAGVSPATITKPSDVLDVIAVDMPNVRDIPKDTDWSQHRVSVDSVERASGFDLLAALPNSVEEVLESGDRAPTARITGAGLAGGNEGETLSFSAATSSDPDVGGPLDDVLSYQWSVDGAVVGIQSTLAYAFRDNGTYAVRVVVADRFGAADTTVTMVTVLNVAPSVAAFAGGSGLRGERYEATAAFSDPGADRWTATVSYGDGSAPVTVTPAGRSVGLSHVYTTPGTYTVTVQVSDGLASGTQTATVVVKAPTEGAAVLTGMVRTLADAGTISASVAGSLTAKSDAAARQFGADRPSAVHQVQAFVNEVNGLQSGGVLSATEGGTLVAYAQRVIRSAGA